jgi:adenylate kinase family enzyme
MMAPRAYARPSRAEVVLGRRIMIHGATGSGKTTLSRRLGELLGIHVVELDAIRHDGGWDATPWEAFRERLAIELESHPEGWVTEGNYSRVADIPLATAVTIIWLHVPQRVSFLRVFRRTVYRVRSGRPFYKEDGPVETFRQSFLSRKSILLWSLTQHGRTARSIRARLDSPHGARVYEVRTRADVQAIIAAAEREASGRSVSAC